ncbi:hypothetical protein Pyn_01226 [Prunus yedoensis var. nudiflora]|uniref:Uncharacterized protein n=1 Tax=Prunus yedoensis var. nudiflora TaxID=2094558 RepID=A0A315B2J0_PRUYE|nr:hypothetical protein Pyn_01226 [Prunus yedoensis var. nudiflora]
MAKANPNTNSLFHALCLPSSRKKRNEILGRNRDERGANPGFSWIFSWFQLDFQLVSAGFSAGFEGSSKRGRGPTI